MSNQLENQEVLNAYQAIVQEIIDFTGGKPWDVACAKYKIFFKMINSKFWSKKDDEYTYIGISNIRDEVADASQEGIYYLRKHLMDLTGDRIWGLTFTLYPTGKFEIDYDYNKPDGYEETDETITGEEINQSLFDLGFRAAPTDKAPKGNE